MSERGENAASIFRDAPDPRRAEEFREQGFAVFPRALPPGIVDRLAARFEPLFDGSFETGLYPDEWYWRKGLSRPDVTRQIGNAWKSDRYIASVVLSAALGRLASQLMGWNGARIAQDTIWWKEAGGRPIALHQDDSYMRSFRPGESVTCWMTLDDTHAEAGTIEYVAGSHRWPDRAPIGEFHAPEGDYRAAMRCAAEAAGVNEPKIVPIVAPAGTLVVHSGRIWHGSGPNRSEDRRRRSVAVHLIRSDAMFADASDYIFGRYRRIGSDELDESFFPVIWTTDDGRSSHLANYASDALA